MRALIVRNLSFSICASALWALLPVIARDQLGLGAGGFGLLSAGFGIGAVIGAMTIPRQIQRISLNTVVIASVLLWVASTVLIAYSGTTAARPGRHVRLRRSVGRRPRQPVCRNAKRRPGMGAGASSRHEPGRSAGKPGGRKRGLGIAGSAFGIQDALAASAAMMLFLLLLNRRVRVRLGNDADVTPAAQLPDLGLAAPPRPDDGPVLIQVEYRVSPENVAPFLRAIHAIERTRRRNGADELARVPRYRRAGLLRRTLHHCLVGRVRAPAQPYDGDRPSVAGHG